MKVAAACVDSGNWSEKVYAFTGPRFYRRVFSIKGASDPRGPIWPRRPSRPKNGRMSALFSVGSTAGKEITVARLSIDQPGLGFCNFPAGRDYDYFEMLLAERPIRKIREGCRASDLGQGGKRPQ